MDYENSLSFARHADQNDPLRDAKRLFHQPQKLNGKRCIYFCGNSLGLQPKRTKTLLDNELKNWREQGVLAWHNDETGWLHYHEILAQQTAPIVGAKPEEVAIMNTLTVNLHLMMVSFYRPTAKRFKILMESSAFSSDQYAVESQLRLHGYDPKDALIEVASRAGETCLRLEDIENAIENAGESLALVLFSGVQYYTGQFFDIGRIAAAAHRAGAMAGFDLAHAVGNVPLSLHEIGADFAVWCSYKYLNSGPGGVGGAFIHEKHHGRFDLPRMAGWWGYHLATRFQMQSGFVPMSGAAGWQISTAQVLPFAANRASLEVFTEVGGSQILRKKSIELTNFLIFLLKKSKNFDTHFDIITPQHSHERGAQLSLLFKTGSVGKTTFQALQAAGVVGDWREPNVIRLTPVPLYNSFEEVFKVGNIF